MLKNYRRKQRRKALAKHRTTPERITWVKNNEVFVFGSNLSGKHYSGAANNAMDMGAIFGQASGRQGDTYAIPTVDELVENKLSITVIKSFVDQFITYARARKDITFYVTEIGCGIAGHTVDDVAPLFAPAAFINNIHLPKRFWDKLFNNE